MITFLRTYLISLKLVTAVERLQVVHDSVDFIVLSFEIMDSIVVLWNPMRVNYEP